MTADARSSGAAGARLDVRPLEAGDLDAAAALLAERHRRHRLAEPLLDPAYEELGAARREIEALLAVESADGWFASRAGTPAGFLVGISKSTATWGGNVWVESAGHAATDAPAVRALYSAAAAAWVDAGRPNHHVLLPATDRDLIEAWFGLDFGQQHIHAVRALPPASFGVVPDTEMLVRRAARADIPALVDLELVLPRHSRRSPVFSRLEPEPADEVRANLEADIDDGRWTMFVAEVSGRVVGSAIGCALTESSTNSGLVRPANAGFLGYAAVLPGARGLGVGRALGETVLAWARDAGYAVVATDWRSTNLEADRSWRGLGFRPTFLRLHRLIG
ncbi:MAG TPA: GNAT family N-acetyltransferase [Candidatus Limnocylindrales bacterium]|nr:GNAT family N-acetyltransferase [Candidatus Limnocylindrales bacterium]